MAIEKIKDSRTKKEMLLANGAVTGVFLNPLKNIKTYAGAKGQEWTPTHSVALVVDGVKISLGLTDKDKVTAKDDDGNYHDVVKGVEVSVVVEQDGEYQGKPQYKAFAKDVLVIDASGAQSQQETNQSSGAPKTPYKPKDNTGVLQGHALKGGAALVASGLYTFENLAEAAIKFHDITKNVKEWYAKNSEGLDEFSIGNGAGNAVNTAVQYIGDLDEIENEAISILRDVLPKVTEHIKNEGKTVVKKTAPKKTSEKNTVTKKTTQKPVDDDDAFGGDVDGGVTFDDSEEDCPF